MLYCCSYMLMKKVLRRYELDVFIATITSPLLGQPHYLQSIQVRARHVAYQRSEAMHYRSFWIIYQSVIEFGIVDL